MTDLTERLRLIAAWRMRGGPTPKQACPSVYETATEAAATLETLTQENARLREALKQALDAPMIDHSDSGRSVYGILRKALGGGDE